MCDNLKHYHTSFSTKKVIHNSFFCKDPSQLLPLVTRIASPHLLPLLCAMEARTSTASPNARVPRTQDDVEIVSSALSSTSKPRSEEILVSRQSLHPPPHSSRLPMSRPQTWLMKLALPGEKMRQSAWRRPPGCLSLPSQASVGW